MEYIRTFLDIQKIRFSSRFNYEMVFEDACWDCVIPKLLIQPIIENSIKYGFKAKVNLDVRISGWVKEDILYIRVEDDGPGMEAEAVENLTEHLQQSINQRNSLGLHNIARRLKLKYGDRSGMTITSQYGEGFCVLLVIEQHRA